MQQVAAFSNPQTVPVTPRRANPWILDRWRDLVLYVCTPLLIVPIFALASARWSPENIYLFVAAFCAMCGSWFAAGVLLSQQRMADVLETYYGAGGPFISPALLRVAQLAALALAIAFSALFLANYIWTWIHGHRASLVKLVLLATSIVFWWYCNNIVASILVGIALFEVFHDVQYLSLVWIYNRNRVEKDSSIGGFMRFVFRRSGSLIGLYIGLVFAYGSSGYLNSHIGVDTGKKNPPRVWAALGFLHFYFNR